MQAVNDIGIYTTAHADYEKFDLATQHLKVRVVDFVDGTDDHDALVVESKHHA